MTEQLQNDLNSPTSTLAADITSSASSLTVSSGEGSRFPASGNFRILIGSELILVGARSSDTLSSLTRGIESTTAAAHTSGDHVELVFTKAALDQYLLEYLQSKKSGIVLFDSTLGADTASIDTGAAGIDTSYQVLEVFIYCRTDEAVVTSSCTITFNNDASSIYDRQLMRGANTSSVVATSLATAGMGVGVAGASCASGVFSTICMRIPEYAKTNGNKMGDFTATITDTTAANCRVEVNGFGYRTTTAISRMKIAAPSGKNFKAGTRLLIIGY